MPDSLLNNLSETTLTLEMEVNHYKTIVKTKYMAYNLRMRVLILR